MAQAWGAIYKTLYESLTRFRKLFENEHNEHNENKVSHLYFIILDHFQAIYEIEISRFHTQSYKSTPTWAACGQNRSKKKVERREEKRREEKRKPEKRKKDTKKRNNKLREKKDKNKKNWTRERQTFYFNLNLNKIGV